MSSNVCPPVVRALVIAAVTMAMSPAAAQAESETSKLDPVLQALSRQLTGHSRVIVEFLDQPDARIITRHGGIAGRQLTAVDAQVAEFENTELATVAANPLVRRLIIDRPVFGTLERTGAATGATIAREEFGVTGKGVGVAVIDSGITAWHDDLYLTRGRSPRVADRIVHFKDFTRETSPNMWRSEHPSDDYGHGTHVSGIIAGNGFDSSGARTGVAPGATLIGLKVLDAEGFGYVSDVIAAIDYAIAVKDLYNIRVMNVSVASGVFESFHTDPLAQAAKRAVDAGIVVVAAAGNLGTNQRGESQFGGITCPGNAPWVLTVGAASHQGTPPRGDDILARFSSLGPTRIDRAAKPDLVAYGVGIESLSDPHSTLYSTFADYLLDGTRHTAYKPYLSLSGTSMSAPVATGTVALMLEVNPALTPNAVKAILQYTAEEREGESFFAQGAGLLNTRGAIRMAGFFAEPEEGLEQPGDTIEGEWIAWSREIVWGNERVAGGLLLPGSNAWRLGVTWGAEATATGRPIVWGVVADDSLIWGTKNDDSLIWGTKNDDSLIWGTSSDDSLIWGTSSDDSLIWGTSSDDSLIWGTSSDDSLIWGTSSDDSVIWATSSDDSLIWGTSSDDSLIWGTSSDDSLIWGTGSPGQILWPVEPPVDNRRRNTSGRR